jgi:predicted  nucleic acid-binding Zn-ribbon protein
VTREAIAAKLNMGSPACGAYCAKRHRGETAVTEDLQDRNARLRGKIEQLVDKHPELEAVVNDVALKQPTASLEKVQANLQERARAIIEAKPELEGYFEH